MENSDNDYEPQATSTQVKKRSSTAALKGLLQGASKKTKSNYLTTILQKASTSDLAALVKRIDARKKPEAGVKSQGTPLRGILKSPSNKKPATDTDDSSDDDESNKPLPKDKESVAVSDSSSDDDDGTDEKHGGSNAKKMEKPTLLKTATKDSDSSSDEESQKRIQNVRAQNKQVQKKPTLLKTATKDSDSSSDEESQKRIQNVRAQNKQVQKKPTLLKTATKDSDSSSDEESQKRIQNVRAQIKQVQKKTPKQKDSDSSSDEEDKKKITKTNVQAQINQTQKKPMIRKLKKEDTDSSSEEEGSRVKTPKLTPVPNNKTLKVEKKPADKSDSSSEDSEDSELSSNSSDDEKQTKPTPTRKETTKSSSSESGSGEDEKEKSPPRPASKNKSTTDEEKLLMRMETSEAQRILRNFAETKKLKKASSNTMDISKMISDKDEVYFMKVTKKLDPQLLTGLEISLDEAEKFTIGNDHYKSTVGTEVKELMLLTQCDNKYALQNVSLSGCVTINEDHPVEILNYTFESEEDENISVPSETLKQRHPLFGADYVDKITLDNDVIAKLDGLIETLKKKYEKKDKSLKKEEQSKLEHEEIFNILNSHVPGKKEKKRSASGDNSKAAFENDAIAQVLKSPIHKKKERRKSITINDSMNNISIEKKLNQSNDDHSAKKKEKKSDVLLEVTPHKIKKKKKSETEPNSEISQVVRKKKKHPDPDDDFQIEIPKKKKKKKKSKGLEGDLVINSTMVSPRVEQPKFTMEESRISTPGSDRKKPTEHRLSSGVSDHLEVVIDEVARNASGKKKKKKNRECGEVMS